MKCRHLNKYGTPIFFTKRWPLCCLLFLALSCNTQKENEFSKRDSLIGERKARIAFAQVHQVKNLVKSGDLILRTGKDFTSELMRRLSQNDKTYSHCGIASWEKDTLFVYHAIGGEWNPDQKLRRDRFEFFCNPYENRGIGIFRYRVNELQRKKIIRKAHYFYRQGVIWDMQFDLASDDRMYCSEFVFKTIGKAASDSVILGTTTLDNHTFVAIDNLFVTPFCTEIKKVIFQ